MAIFLIIALVSVVSGFENSSDIVIFESKEALITFRYKSDVFAPFSIGIGRRPPFYVNGQLINERLPLSQRHRFQVNAWHSQTRHYTLIHLKIDPVQRTDGGTYTCIFGLPYRLQRKALTVNFPPGRADCREYPTNGNSSVILRCSATGGSPNGRIICWDSKNEEIPFRGDVGQNETHIIQEVLIQRNTSLSCCAINGARLVKHKCNDFVLRSEYHGEINEQESHLSSTQASTIKEHLTTLSTNMQTTGKETCGARVNPWTYIATISLCVIGIMTIYIIFLRRKILKDRQKEHKITRNKELTIKLKDISAETVYSTLPKLPPTTDIHECNDE